MSIYKYIALGTDYKEWFNYDGKPLPIRPLSTYELDEVLRHVVEKGVSPFIFESVIKVKFNMAHPDQRVDLDQKHYTNFAKYYNELDYWTVYYSMKDFQPEEFSEPDFDEEFEKYPEWEPTHPKGYYIVKKMKYIHELADKIRSMTTQPLTNLVEVLSNNKGKILASRIHQFHVPLASEAWKITPLQSKFMYYSRSGAPQILKSEKDLPGIKAGTMQEIVEQMKELGL